MCVCVCVCVYVCVCAKVFVTLDQLDVKAVGVDVCVSECVCVYVCGADSLFFTSLSLPARINCSCLIPADDGPARCQQGLDQ